MIFSLILYFDKNDFLALEAGEMMSLEDEISHLQKENSRIESQLSRWPGHHHHQSPSPSPSVISHHLESCDSIREFSFCRWEISSSRLIISPASKAKRNMFEGNLFENENSRLEGWYHLAPLPQKLKQSWLETLEQREGCNWKWELLSRGCCTQKRSWCKPKMQKNKISGQGVTCVR